jgi:hypothetical protein
MEELQICAASQRTNIATKRKNCLLEGQPLVINDGYWPTA